MTKRVLIVDDNADNRKLLFYALRSGDREIHQAELGDDVIGLGPAIRIVDDRQQCLDHVRVWGVAFGGEDDDGVACPQADDLQITQFNGAARPTDDAGTAGGPDFFANFLLHLNFVLVAHNDDAGLGFVGIGDDQFGNDR